MTKRNRIGPKHRAEIVKLCETMIKNGVPKKTIVETITEAYGFYSTQSCGMSLVKYGIKWPEKPRFGKPDRELPSGQNNVDVVRHPHLKVARIIDAMEGYTSEFKDGQIYVNGKPYPVHLAYGIAGEAWPPNGD